MIDQKSTAMITKHLLSFYKRNYFVLEGNLKGITHDESVNTHPTGGSSINWVLGHILHYRCLTLSIFNKDMPQAEQLKALYDFGTKPNANTTLPFEDMVALYEETQKLLEEILEGTKGDVPKEDKLVFLAYHETMHSGQVAILRRMLGKASGVKYG